MPPKGRKKVYQMPEPLPEGEILKDTRKKEWKLGKPLGSGGFGLIYRAAENSPGKVSEDAEYVVKIEPHENGPLFTELHFYQRAAQPDKVDSWKKQHKLVHLGVPKLFGGGSHERGSIRYRFLVMKRFGEDVWKKYVASGMKFDAQTTFALALQILDALEYLHGNEYAHADIKSANLLLGYAKKDQNKVYLVDFGLVSRFKPEGKHKEYKKEPKKGHNGTPEFTSIDAHEGAAPTRRGDIQILAYVMLQWMCTKLPWEGRLDDMTYVMNQKIKFSRDIGGLFKICFKGAPFPEELKKFFDHAFKLAYTEEPNYSLLRDLCESVLRREGFKKGAPFPFGATSTSQNGVVRSPGRARVKSPTSPVQTKKRKAPSKERDSSLVQGRKRTKDGKKVSPASGDAAVSLPSPVKKKTAVKNSSPTKNLVKSPTAAKARATKARAPPTKKEKQIVSNKGAGTSTPSRRVRKPRTRPEMMTSSSTQTTPGLEARAAARR